MQWSASSCPLNINLPAVLEQKLRNPDMPSDECCNQREVAYAANGIYVIWVLLDEVLSQVIESNKSGIV